MITRRETAHMSTEAAPPLVAQPDRIHEFLTSLDYSQLEKVSSNYRSKARAMQDVDALNASIDMTIAIMADHEIARRDAISQRANELLE